MKNILFLITTIIMFSSCTRTSVSPCLSYDVFRPPSIFAFDIKHKNILIADSVLNALKLFYKSNGGNIYVSDFQRRIAEYYPLGIMVTQEIGFKSADNLIKDYYLEFPNGDIDTLYVDYRHYTPCEADTSSCRCTYPLIKVIYNNHEAFFDRDLLTNNNDLVYQFNK